MRCSRRAFLEAGLALPAVLHSAPEPGGWRSSGPAFSQDSSFDPWVEIHAENLRHNVTEISRRVSVRPILAVIKNNGYGLGVVNVAQLLEPQPEIFGFAVVKLHEAFSLRDAGIRKPILLLGPFDEQNLADAVAREILPMVYTALGPALEKIAAKQQKPVSLHVCVDTGIGRVGVPYHQAAALLGDLAGYNRAYMAKDDVWVATIPVGHADGWPRAAAKGAKVRINGDLYPVIATVSASHSIVEIGAEEKVKIGDVATLFDAQSGSRPEDVSEACGASVYDLTMHLNPLLPRRVV